MLKRIFKLGGLIYLGEKCGVFACLMDASHYDNNWSFYIIFMIIEYSTALAVLVYFST